MVELEAFGGVVLFGIRRSFGYFSKKFELLFCLRYAATCFKILSEVMNMDLVESIFSHSRVKRK